MSVRIKIMDIPIPKNKNEVKQYIGLINTIYHQTNRMNASYPNLRSKSGSKTEMVLIADFHKDILQWDKNDFQET